MLTKYYIAVQSGACSLVTTQPPGVSTFTVAVVTVTAQQQTTTSASTTIVAAATAAAPNGPIKVQNPISPYSGLYTLFVAPTISSGTEIKLTSDAAQAADSTISLDQRLLYDDRELMSNLIGYQGLLLALSILALCIFFLKVVASRLSLVIWLSMSNHISDCPEAFALSFM